MLRVVLVNYGHHADIPTAGALLERYETLTGWARGLTQAGARVVAVQGFRHDQSLERDGVRYEFVAGRYVPTLRRWRIPHRLHQRIRRHRPDVVHLNGLLFPLQAAALRWALPARSALVGQFHAEGVGRGLTGLAETWGLRAFDGLIFTSRLQAEPWRRRGLIRPRQPVFEIAEGSNSFTPDDRHRARAKTGMEGRPIFLWVGHLNSNKDPLTVLRGFEGILGEWPQARLYMIFRDRELLAEVENRLVQGLAQAVVLLGAVPHEEIEPYFNSADYFVLGSHHEGSGYSLIEALACGVVPVVTDIPSYRFLTRDGTLGALWPPGDPAALRQALRQVLRDSSLGRGQAARSFFEESLSYPAIGRQALAAYHEVLARRRP